MAALKAILWAHDVGRVKIQHRLAHQRAETQVGTRDTIARVRMDKFGNGTFSLRRKDRALKIVEWAGDNSYEGITFESANPGTPSGTAVEED